MKNLTMPKHSADPKELIAVLEVYEEAKTWLHNDKYIPMIKKKLRTSQEPQAYTKKTQIHSYFGFLEWQKIEDKRSPKKISKAGQEFLKALKNNNQEEIFKLILNALETRTFGKNVQGVNSNSFIEPPNLFVFASIQLGYLTLNEFGHLLDNLTQNNIYKLILEIKKNRIGKNISFEISNKASDPKPILAMQNWGFLEDIGKINRKKKLSISQKFLEIFYERLTAIEPFNNLEIEKIKKPSNDINSFLDYEIAEYSFSKGSDKKKKQRKITNSGSVHNTSQNTETGVIGENYVYDYEVRKLKRHGRKDLAYKVVKQFEDKSFFPGYDVKSFNLEGEEIYIEVKSSRSLKKNNFIMTRNEIRAAKKFKENYFIYRVVNTNTNPWISYKFADPIKLSINGEIEIEPCNYEISFFD